MNCEDKATAVCWSQNIKHVCRLCSMISLLTFDHTGSPVVAKPLELGEAGFTIRGHNLQSHPVVQSLEGLVHCHFMSICWLGEGDLVNFYIRCAKVSLICRRSHRNIVTGNCQLDAMSCYVVSGCPRPIFQNLRDSSFSRLRFLCT